MFGRHEGLVWVMGLASLCTSVHADGLLYRYEADVLPDDPAAGWWCGDPCVSPCEPSVGDGVMTYFWDNGGLRFNCNHTVTEPPAESPATFWAEWSFASNHLFSGVSVACDGTFIVDYKDVVEIFRMFGDVAMTFGGIRFSQPLEIGQFHTYRFESADGVNWCILADGTVFHCQSDTKRWRRWQQSRSVWWRRRVHSRFATHVQPV